MNPKHFMLDPKSSGQVKGEFIHKIIVYLHVKELGRMSNTGALVQVEMPYPRTDIHIEILWPW